MANKVKNPYENTANSLVGKYRVGNFDDFLKRKIKDKELLEAIRQIISLRQHVAFDEGVKAGKEWSANTLNEILSHKTEEDRNFCDE